MEKDWKSALSSIRDNFEETDKEIGAEITIEDTKPEYLQKEPLYVVTERKGRNGKTATIIEGFIIQKEEVEEIARKLKQKLGVGGSCRDNEILIQGDYKDAVKNLLQQYGFKTK